MSRRTVLRVALLVTAGLALDVAPAPAAARGSPIRHVVVIYQENHSFDNVLGRLCVRDHRCDGAVYGTLADGSSIRLRKSSDYVPVVPHGTASQTLAVDAGRMDGFERLFRCQARQGYHCFTQYVPSQIPNLARLARGFAISDRTFQMDGVPSWGAHLELVTQDLDGFSGDAGKATQATKQPHAGGWGCDSRLDAQWRPDPSSPWQLEPACVPDFSLDADQYPYGGAYRPTDVDHIPTLMDRLDAAGRSWKLYAATAAGSGSGYAWAICPTFAGCLYTSQRQNQVPHRDVLGDASRGKLPSFSVVLPAPLVSQHNRDSMAVGDNWIGDVVQALESGPQWRSTAIFITYDDCGCFYDHVPPPPGLGIRSPMVIVSPWARPQYTDSHVASAASLLAFTEHTFDLPPLGPRDAAAYDYAHAFDFSQRPLRPIEMTHTKIRPAEQRRIDSHPRVLGAT